MRVLVTGGAGYIGSVVAAQLVAAGHDVVVLDDLSTGHADAVPPGATFVKGTLRDCAAEVLSDGVEAVLHFAAKSLVGESVADPAKYWSNNLGGTVALLEAMREIRIRTIVFSSTAAVYGEPEGPTVQETDPTRPTSPYGASKLAVDTTLTEFCRLYGFGAISLRYFNVAGAHSVPAPAARRFRRPLAGRAAQPGDAPHPERAGRRAPRDGRCGSSATTTPPPTGPASATTSTSPTWPTRTCARWPPAGPASTGSSTWATGPASRSAR